MSNIEKIQILKNKIKELQIEQNIFDQKQMALKILLNSGYGAFANEYFILFDVRLAKSITYTAQLVTRWMINHLSKRGIEIVYSDTDSLYITINKYVKKYCDAKKINYDDLSYDDKRLIFSEIDTKIQEIISQGYDELSIILNVREKTFKMEREIYGDRGIWLGKKNYVIKMIDKSGISKKQTDKPYVKGYDIAKKAATTNFIINLLEQYVELVFFKTRTDLIDFERENFKKYKELPYSELFSPKSINSLNNYESVESKGAQAHIKGALSYNKIVKENKLEGQYPIITEGAKIKYSYILMPNKLGSNTIAYHDEADGDKFIKFALEKYNLKIDYNKMWDTDFVKPAHRLTDALKMNMSNVNKNSFLSLFK